MEIFNVYKKVFCMLLLQGVLLISCVGHSMAQTTPPDNLQFTLVALDALTKGAVSAETIQVQFGV